MAQIKVEHLTFSYEGSYDTIFDDVSFYIDTDWKLGFIGRNGRGKTTFLRLLQGQYPYQGTISTSMDFDYFPFEVAIDERRTVDAAKDMIAPFRQWEKEMDACLAESDEWSIGRYGELLELYQDHDGYKIEEMIEKEVQKLDVEAQVLEQPFNTLSPGERTKVMLACLFLKKNKYLLIDEPTDHVDTNGREVLANYMNSKKGFILVSHDRAFLNKCIDHVISINRYDIEIQKGNYTTWKENRERQDAFEQQQNESLKKDIGRLNDARRQTAKWSDNVEKSKFGEKVPDRGHIGHMAAKMMKRSKSLEKRQDRAIEEKQGLLKNIEARSNLKMNILPAPKQKLVEIQNLSFGYGENLLIQDMDLQINNGDRIAVTGKNGCGKSTLLKLITGQLEPVQGQIKAMNQIVISYVNQNTDHLHGSLQEYAAVQGIDQTLFMTILRQMSFEREQLEKSIQFYSAGQKKKVLLAGSIASPAHLWIWDEPLNYVDILSRVEIESLLLTFEPTLIFVEHDAVFTETVATRKIVL